MSNTALCLTALLLLIPIFISYKEGLHIIKDLVIATIRATIQLLILGFYYIIFSKLMKMVISAMCVSHYYQCILEYNKSCSPVMHHVLDIICGYICGNSSTIGSNCCYRCN